MYSKIRCDRYCRNFFGNYTPPDKNCFTSTSSSTNNVATQQASFLLIMDHYISSPRKIFDALAMKGFEQKSSIQSDQVGMEIPKVIRKWAHVSAGEKIFWFIGKWVV